MKRALMPLLLASCSGPPQKQDEVQVVYRAGFSAEQGVMTEVLFPFPNDGLEGALDAGISVSDGGTAALIDDQQGPALKVSGQGAITASFTGFHVKGIPTGTGIPAASLTRGSVDAGYYFRVNKGGSASADVDFEYTVSKDCGGGCGGTESWKFSGPVGLALQVLQLSFTEEKTP
ncbi:MAG: hypothetical protein QM723_02365 [Myxococcaceae bacterium]